MWALIKRGSVNQVFKNPISVRIDGILHPPGMFSIWDDAERKAIGIYNYREVNADYDDRFIVLVVVQQQLMIALD